MKIMNVEFFHDVICSFCYPMSYRMRKVAKEMPELNIMHKSYALAPDDKSYEVQFGSRKNVKDEVVGHWVHANQNDDLHRFNIEGMKKTDFLFPTSVKPLRAAKAGKLLGGEEVYWDVFDALQKALFTDNKNIEDEEVIFEIIKGLNIDFEKWLEYFNSQEVIEAVDADLYLARQYNIQSVPALIVDQRYILSGAQPYEVILESLKEIYKEKYKDEEVKLESIGSGESCNFEDGQWKCD